MPSPLPGMDPWLEGDLFPDLHGSLIYLIREALNAAMPPGYAALGNYLVWKDDAPYRVPDGNVTGPRPRPAAIGGAAALPGLLDAGPAPAREPRKAPHLEIRADRGERVVTAVEILSPSNKARGGKGRKAYLKKQDEFRDAGVNLVEIDLLRAGTHTTAVPLPQLRRAGGRSDYHISVLVTEPSDQLYVAAIRLADRLPAIGVPLDPGVPPILLDLQPLLDRAYDTGRYARFADYPNPPDPPLTAEQAEWAAGVLRARGVLPPADGGPTDA